MLNKRNSRFNAIKKKKIIRMNPTTCNDTRRMGLTVLSHVAETARHVKTVYIYIYKYITVYIYI